jgi:hypothetical protein
VGAYELPRQDEHGARLVKSRHVDGSHLLIEWRADGVLGQPDEFGVGAACSEDLGIAQSDHASPLSLKRPSHHGCAAGLSATTHDPVDELDESIIESHSNLLAHTKMVPLWDQKIQLLRPSES